MDLRQRVPHFRQILVNMGLINGPAGVIRITPSIASGGQADIYLCHRRSDRAKIVEKVYFRTHKIDESETALLKRIYANLQDINVFAQILEFPTIAYPVCSMEYYNGGDLHRLIYDHQDQDKPVPEFFIWHCFDAITDAICFLHTGERNGTEQPPPDWKPILHRDLKPANIILAQNVEGRAGLPQVRVCDFDLADFYDPNLRCRQRFGTWNYQPAEQAISPEHSHPTPAGDVWAVGGIIHALATGHAPYSSHEDRAMYNHEKEERLNHEIKAAPKVVEKLGETYSSDLEEKMCLALTDFESRASARELRRAVAPAARMHIAELGVDMTQVKMKYDRRVGS